MTMIDNLKMAIPAQIRPRLRSAEFSDGRATFIVDVAGLDRPEAEQIQREIEAATAPLDGVNEVRVALMADRVARKIIAVGSGKGGVGKSTLTANLAVALSRAGHKVGVVDADIYGPSQVTLLDPQGQGLEARGNTIVSAQSPHGPRVVSMAHMVEAGKAIAWRGPMVGRALTQMMEADWADTELLLVDLPPGTGDVQLTMLQKFRPAGAVIVSTPQDLALIDARRAIDLFRQAKVPVAGLVENMAGYACPHCGEISDPFGSGGAEAAAGGLGVPFLGRIPLAMDIRAASDGGRPPASGEDENAAPFAAIAGKLAAWLDAEG